MIEIKKCSKCKTVQSFNSFTKSKRTRDGRVSWCKKCIRKFSKQYYRLNKIRILNQHNEYYSTNKSKVLQQYKDHYKENKIDILQKHKTYLKNNPEKRIRNDRVRKSIFERAIPCWAELDRIAIVYQKRDELNESWNKEGISKFVVDHIIPLNPKDQSVCGLHVWYNLQLLERTLNSQKHDRYENNW